MFDLHNGDCIEVMLSLPDNSVDLILTDPPYGTTACAWDTVIPFSEMWTQIERVIKKNSPVVFTSSQPFSSALGFSKIEWLKYSLVWEKNRSTGHIHAKNKPMKKHEDILVFSEGTTIHEGQSANRMIYNPQGLIELKSPVMRARIDQGNDAVLAKRKSHRPTLQKVSNYPSSVLNFDIVEVNDKSLRTHPTQKPVDLMKYLILTYSDENSIVLDFTMGSGTTGVACMQSNRRFIGIEKDQTYFETAKRRIETAYRESY